MHPFSTPSFERRPHSRRAKLFAVSLEVMSSWNGPLCGLPSVCGPNIAPPETLLPAYRLDGKQRPEINPDGLVIQVLDEQGRGAPFRHYLQ